MTFEIHYYTRYAMMTKTKISTIAKKSKENFYLVLIKNGYTVVVILISYSENVDVQSMEDP